ncbi:MAG: hypothetical protein AAGB22_06960, partial [Bacteroidota bacterium]
MHTRPLFPILLVLLLLSDFAQAQTKVTFTGAGRMAIYNNSISGDALDGDTTTADRALSGHALFDMGL